MIYRMSCYIFLCDSISNDTAEDFETNNLDMKFTNPVITLYGKSKSAYNGDMLYVKSLIQ